jgi:hypothetical protein
MSLQRFSMVALSISIVMMMESPLLRRQRSGGSQFEAKMGKKLMRPPITAKKLGVVVGTCGPNHGRHR